MRTWILAHGYGYLNLVSARILSVAIFTNDVAGREVAERRGDVAADQGAGNGAGLLQGRLPP